MAALGAVAYVISAIGGIAAGVAQKNAADFEAQQQEMQGKEEFAAAQREAEQKRKEATYVQSRQQALAAASGGGADDPTIVRLMTTTAQQGDLNARTATYVGEQRKRGLFDQAMATRMTGRANMVGSFLGAAGSLASGFGKLYDTPAPTSYG